MHLKNTAEELRANIGYFSLYFASEKTFIFKLALSKRLEQITKKIKGKIYIYGAGAHTDILLSVWKKLKLDSLDICGVLDNYKTGEIFNLPILNPSKADRSIPVLISSRIFQEDIYKILLQLGWDPDKIIKIYEPSAITLWEGNFSKKIPLVNVKSHFVFLSDTPNFNLFKLSLYLRKSGYRTTYIVLENVEEKFRDFLQKYFDKVICGNFTPEFIIALLSSLKAKLLHISGGRSIYYLTPLSRLYFSGPILVEPDDVFGIMFSKRSIDKVAENILFTCASGFIHKEGSYYNSYLESSRKPVLHFRPYPIPELFRFSWPDGNVKIVYSGSITPYCYASGYMTSYFVLEAKRMLEKIGISLDIISKETYLPDEISNVIKDYHFGLSGFPFDPRNTNWQEKAIKSTFSTKILSYIEAGIPVIVNSLFEEMSNFVRKNEVGLAIKSEDFSNLGNILENADYSKLKEGVLSYRRRENMENKIIDLVEFYSKFASL